MVEFLVQAPASGLNTLLPDNMISPQEAAVGTKNIIYDRGLLKTPFGYSKLSLTSSIDGINPVLHVFQWEELDRSSHIMAITTKRIFDYDRVNEDWDDKTGNLLSGNLSNPVSYTVIGHTDVINLNDDSTKSEEFHHIVLSDGGLSDIKRWAGRREANFLPLTGGGDYHDGTTHRAKHAGVFRSRAMLLSPKTFSSSSNTWSDNNQTIRWPQVGKLQTWTGTGSGFFNLIETGGTNMWAAGLGGQYIIYQTRGIWSINWIGGSDVFSPRPEIPNLGLLESHLLVAKNNVHYFVGSDYNVYAYFGGTSIQSIGDKITEALRDDLNVEFQNRSWMSMDQDGERLWIFIVVDSNQFITKAYGLDLKDGTWMIRDFSDLYTTTSGITAVNLVNSETYQVGPTYLDALETISEIYDSSANPPQRYGDVLVDISIAPASDLSDADWSAGAGGLDVSQVGRNFNNDFTENDILMVADGSSATNWMPGTHYYTLKDVSANGFSVVPRWDGTFDGTAIATYKLDFTSGEAEISIGVDVSGSVSNVGANVANIISICGDWTAGNKTGYLILTNPTGDFTIETLGIQGGVSAADITNGDWTLFGKVGFADNSTNVPQDDHASVCMIVYRGDNSSDGSPGATYRSIIDEIRTKARMVLGDSCGFVYQFDNTIFTYDGQRQSQWHYTPNTDIQIPDQFKRWGEISFVAKGEFVMIEYTLDDGQTWNFGGTFILTDNWATYRMFVNRSSERIQFRVGCVTTSIPNLVSDPDFTENRIASDLTSYHGPWGNVGVEEGDKAWFYACNTTSGQDCNAFFFSSVNSVCDNFYQQIDRIVPGRSYNLKYDWFDSHTGMTVQPYLGGTAGTLVNSSDIDDFTQKTDTIIAGNGKVLLFEADSPVPSLLKFSAIREVSLTEIPAGDEFMVRELKLLNTDVMGNR